ncbi:phenylalanine--tRNA ligase subunit beta [bacterium AH-315-M05]|nr:phenylalanine--tRNA ligase subunit beta [bacterium AH-315-M05]
MKISYNWLKEYIDIDLEPGSVADILTNCGLEVEGVEKFESVKGGLEGLVIGEVKSKEKHPNADKLSITKVNVGNGEVLNIICGAPNVDAGQKVVVATIGTVIHPINGESFEIKKARIRGEESEGMICAEDEIGMGTEHEGIIVLDPSAEVGSLAKDHFNIEDDTIFEIGLTPNRVDAASHIGVARDLVAVLNCKGSHSELQKPSVEDFKVDNHDLPIEVVVEDTDACPRYSGITISGIEVKESPGWLQNRMKAIGAKPINNIVDITNFVLHETGQPLHAFDADEIIGNQVVIKKLPEGTRFKTLDDLEVKLSTEDLMICNTKEAMVIAGVLGGVKSGVTEKTKNIFIESAYFNPVSIRRTAKRHELNTDASFRFERGADPNSTVYALKRTAILIKEIAGGTISSEIVDVYPKPIDDFKVKLSYSNCDRLIGKEIDRDTIKQILTSLEIEVDDESKNGLSLSVPPFKVDVQREADVIEEILRICGYDNIEISGSVRSSFSAANGMSGFRPGIQENISNLLSNVGFNEIMANSITRTEYYEQSENSVKILNPLNAELGVMRQTLLFGGLEAIVYNQNRRNVDLKLYEFGKSYQLISGKYIETQHLSLFLTGRKNAESWNTSDENVDFYYHKGFVNNIFVRLGIKSKIKSSSVNSEIFTEGLLYEINNKKVVEFGRLTRSVVKQFDIKEEVFYADFNWDNVVELLSAKDEETNGLHYQDVPKFPAVRRDLALLIDREVQFGEIEKIALQTEKHLLQEVNLFDVYEGEKIQKGKKSYAVSFVFQDATKTLTDKQVDKIMGELMKSYEKDLKAVIR